MNLRELLNEAAAGLPDVKTAAVPGGETVWSTRDRGFAVLTGDGSAEFGLDPAVAVAACRTPDVTPSNRGPGWVRFRPAVLDGHGVDRARAWFESAHRRIAGG